METANRREVGEYTYLDVCTPEGSEVTCELGVLEELQAVFNPEMAYACYIPFYCLIGKYKYNRHVYWIIWIPNLE